MYMALRKYLTYISIFFLVSVPSAAMAQNNSFDINEGVFQSITDALQEVYNQLAPIALTLVILYLLYGAFLFATSGGNQEQREEAKDMLLYGTVGLILISSLLGLVTIVLNVISVSGGGMPNVPQIN